MRELTEFELKCLRLCAIDTPEEGPLTAEYEAARDVILGEGHSQDQITSACHRLFKLELVDLGWDITDEGERVLAKGGSNAV